MNSDPSSIRSDVEYLIDAAPRIVKVAGMVAVSVGLADGAREVLREASTSVANDDDRFQALLGYQDSAIMMSVVRVTLLLDSDLRSVSLQNIYKRLKRDDVRQELITAVHGTDDALLGLFGPSPNETVKEFLDNYQLIDWALYGRLIHFRNLGVVHLGAKPNSQTLSFVELRGLAILVCRMADNFAKLCNVSFLQTYPTIKEWTERGRVTLRRSILATGALDENPIHAP